MVDTDETRNHKNHKETLHKPPKRAKEDKISVPNPKRRRVQSVSDKQTGKSHAGKKFKEKHKGKQSKRFHSELGAFRFRHGGSISDPLNLQGKDGFTSECSTCAPSPVDTPPKQASPTPDYFNDPLNLKKGGKKEKQKSRNKKKHSHSTSDLHVKSTAKPEVDATMTALKAAVETHQLSKESQPRKKLKQSKDSGRFCYGNYNRYYGYRIGGVATRDPRIDLLHEELFKDKEVLDIGCNTGQVTIAVARDYKPRQITGIDIDGNLIRTARKNVLRALPLPKVDGKVVKFPLSMVMIYGPLASLPSQDVSTGDYPHNITFSQENYVPPDDSHLEGITPVYDVMLALSLTKWIHLNWGDAGMKRSFQKMFKQLKPGGALILEMQEWDTYKRRKNLTPTISANYKNIVFKPHQFSEYLLSEDVGFAEHHHLGVPKGTSKGFERPLEIFVKGGGKVGMSRSNLVAASTVNSTEDTRKMEVESKSSSNSESDSSSDSDT